MIDLETVFDDDRAPAICLLDSEGTTRYKTPGDLPADWRCEFEERAAIREYDGGQAREHAEAEAFTEILARMGAAGEAV